tara:strand:+ start:129 stop:266 length:138 start_codon:yes stop_codon:yes gene_type:complete
MKYFQLILRILFPIKIIIGYMGGLLAAEIDEKFSETSKYDPASPP